MLFAMGNLGQLRNLLKSEFIERSVSCQIRHERRGAAAGKDTKDRLSRSPSRRPRLPEY